MRLPRAHTRLTAEKNTRFCHRPFARESGMSNWPVVADYFTMLQNPQIAFRDADLKSCQIETHALTRQPVARAGAFACVYKATYPDGRDVALRFFSRPDDNRRDRYAAVSEYLDSLRGDRPASLVDFNCIDKGIRIPSQGGRWAPLMVMEWVPGDTLFDWVRARCHENAVRELREAADEWGKLISELNDTQIAHGDLNHGNVMVTPSGQLKLVDYDCMCVPPLVGSPNPEIGVEPYQHPERGGDTLLDSNLDNFSALLIYITLRALAASPKLWFEFNENNDGLYDKLLFRRDDFESPQLSRLKEQLEQSPDQEVRYLTAKLFDLSCAPMREVPQLRALVMEAVGAESTADAAVPPPDSPVDAAKDFRSQRSPMQRIVPITRPGLRGSSSARSAQEAAPTSPPNQPPCDPGSDSNPEPEPDPEPDDGFDIGDTCEFPAGDAASPARSVDEPAVDVLDESAEEPATTPLSEPTAEPAPPDVAPTGRVQDSAPPVTDAVEFTVSYPSAMKPASHYMLEVWAHLDELRAAVRESTRETIGEDHKVVFKTGVSVERSTELTVQLRVPGLSVLNPKESMIWNGRMTNCLFAMHVPEGSRLGTYPGVAIVSAAQAAIASIPFILTVAREELRTSSTSAASGFRRAFASYASSDRNDVLARIQGIEKARPDMSVFVDVAGLRSGQRWLDQLEQEIDSSDVFYLFWSRAARESEWVEREWKTALKRRGIGFIDPVPLASPQAVPPPRELAEELHFNDWMLAYMR